MAQLSAVPVGHRAGWAAGPGAGTGEAGTHRFELGAPGRLGPSVTSRCRAWSPSFGALVWARPWASGPAKAKAAAVRHERPKVSLSRVNGFTVGFGFKLTMM